MRIGIDLGGSKIEAVVLEGSRLCARKRVATPVGDYGAILKALLDLVSELESGQSAVALPVGIGHPGSTCPGTGLLRNANSTCLNGRAFAADVRALLKRPVALANDANCLAMSELHDGAASGVQSAFFVILGTGVGGAVVQNGQLQTGANALAGEWGHNPLPWLQHDEFPGRRCWCGKSGCVETWLSGPGWSAWHRDSTGQHLSAEAISELALEGNAQALESLQRYAQRLARALASIINLLDPELIVLGGGLSKIQYLYDEVPRLWDHWVFADSVNTQLAPACHGDSSGVFGAARLE